MNKMFKRMLVCLLVILCYCIGLYFLWQDPSDAFYKFLFYAFTSIPIGLFCYKYARGKKRILRGKERVLNVFLVGITVILGASTMLLTLTNFPTEYEAWFNMMFLLFLIGVIVLIFWSKKIGKQ